MAKLIQPLNGRRLKLIIHAGTPKTGTTSMQNYLDKNQRKLRGEGILYPHNIERIKNPHAHKHQWIEKNLVATHTEYFLENFKNIIAQVKDETHTIILSSEGIYNYWWDIPDESKDLLSTVGKHFDVQVWVWFREPLEFIEGFYKQCVRNPQVDGNACYGKNLSLAQMLDLEWFARHLDYQGFVDGCVEVFGEGRVLSFEYDGDVVHELKESLGLATSVENAAPRLNKGLNAACIALLRVINDYDVSAKDKHLLMPHLREVSAVVDGYVDDVLIDEESRRRVLELARPVSTDS